MAGMNCRRHNQRPQMSEHHPAVIAQRERDAEAIAAAVDEVLNAPDPEGES